MNIQTRVGPAMGWRFVGILALNSGCALEVGAVDDAEALGAITEAVANANAIGVVPVASNTVDVADYGIGTTCPRETTAAGSPTAELVGLRMDDEDDSNRTSWTDGWESVQTIEQERWYHLNGNNTWLRFCRVDGAAFKPLTTGAGDAKNFYAVVSLGASCPAGSKRVGYSIDNEDDENENDRFGSIAPNISNSNTTLFFCVFRSGATTMTSFPNLGARYAVFHTWNADQQPDWVLSKHSHYQDDEDDANANQVVAGADAGATAELKKMVGFGSNTHYNFARVR